MNVPNIKTNHSNYWLPVNTDDFDKNNAIELAATKRAITNFVNIVAGDGIKVKYSTGDDSYTDGSTITLSSKFTDGSNFDTTVGLALHEASHILLSNFGILQDMEDSINKITNFDEFKQCGYNAGLVGYEFDSYVKNVLNYIEDRRIDNYIYKTAPGYRNYYQSLYDTYFNNKLVDKMLKSNSFCDETTESYMTRLINLHSAHSNLNSLKYLTEIYKVIDLKNINRLDCTFDVLKITINVCNIIFKATKLSGSPGESDNNSKPKSDTSDVSDDTEYGSNYNTNSGSGNEFDTDNDTETESEDTDTDTETESEDTETESEDTETKLDDDKPTPDDTEQTSPKITLNKGEIGKLSKLIEKQKKFINGDVKKSKITGKLSDSIHQVETSGTEIKNISYQSSEGINTKLNCIIVNNLTESLICSDIFPLGCRNERREIKNQLGIDRGINIGKILAKKIQTRTDDRTTITNRQVSGKIDKRLLASAGYGYEQLFYTHTVSKYKNANIHISIDASGSMNDDYLREHSKWANTLIMISAMAQAAELIQNLNIQISFRSSTRYQNNYVPYILMAYDSRTDKISKIKNLFKKLSSNGTTPESLCYDAIFDKFIPSNTDMDSYFITITDGAPFFIDASGSHYTGHSAINHIRLMKDKFTNRGIKSLAYFIGQVGETNTPEQNIFKKAYGSDGEVLDVTNMNHIIKTINKLLLKK